MPSLWRPMLPELNWNAYVRIWMRWHIKGEPFILGKKKEVKLSADKISKNVFALPVFTLIWISFSQKPSRVLWSLPLSPMSSWSSFCKAQHYKRFNSFLYLTHFRKFTWLNTETLAFFLKNWVNEFLSEIHLKNLFIVKNHMNLEVSQWRNCRKVSSWR